jgi:hypothetical protein
MDIFSTALASADINLDTFQYIEDGMGKLLLLITHIMTVESAVTLNFFIRKIELCPSATNYVLDIDTTFLTKL